MPIQGLENLCRVGPDLLYPVKSTLQNVAIIAYQVRFNVQIVVVVEIPRPAVDTVPQGFHAFELAIVSNLTAEFDQNGILVF